MRIAFIFAALPTTEDRIHSGSMAEEGAETGWNNNAYHAFRERLSSETPPDVCRSCSVYAHTF